MNKVEETSLVDNVVEETRIKNISDEVILAIKAKEFYEAMNYLDDDYKCDYRETSEYEFEFEDEVEVCE